jgi:hypothetical protein
MLVNLISNMMVLVWRISLVHVFESQGRKNQCQQSLLVCGFGISDLCFSLACGTNQTLPDKRLVEESWVVVLRKHKVQVTHDGLLGL